MASIVIPGPVGDLEANWTDSGGQRAVIMCHPHPQYGGSMHDGVLAAIDNALLQAGVSSLRFNFRGVGASSGHYDEGVGEVQDLCAVASWLRQEQPSQRVMLGGYSFGGAVVLAAANDIEHDALILAAPAIGLFGDVARPNGRALVLLGDQDQFVTESVVRDFFSPATTEILMFADADHFFMGAQQQLTECVVAYLGKE